MSRKIDKIAAFAVMVLLSVCTAVNIFHEPRELSEKENRTLAQAPEFSFGALFNGDYIKEFETYAADQFIFRDGAVSVKADVEKLLGKKGSNGVNFGSGGYLLARPRAFDSGVVGRNMDAIKQLDDTGLYNITLAVIPPAFEILKDRLPAYAYEDSAAKVEDFVEKSSWGSNIKVCNTTDALRSHSDEYIYYRTDHHQTALGSFYVYECLGEYLDYTPYGEADFGRERLSKSFRGTSWSKSSTHFSKADTIEKFTLNDGGYSQTVEFPDEELYLDGLYSMDKLDTKDKYSVYLDGNHALTVIKSDCGTGRKLAVFKDSYAHSLAPFLANHYDEIHLFDMRYYSGDIIRYMADNEISDVLVLYGTDTFVSDTNLEKAGEFAETSDYFDPPPFGFLPDTEPVGDDYFEDAVMLGDSIVAGLSMTAQLPMEFACKASVNTETVFTQTVPSGNTVVGAMLSYENISKYYLQLGINEITFRPLESYCDGFRKIIAAIREKNPDAIIYIQSIMPVSHSAEAKSGISKDQINRCNNALVQLAEEEKCYYLNVNGYIAEPDGYLREGAASDGIHFGVPDHRKWEQYLRTHAVQDRRKGRKKAAIQLYSGGGEIDMEAFASDMLDGVPFGGEMTKAGDGITARLFGLGEGEVRNGIVYTCGSAADEFAAFETDSPEAAQKLAEKLRERVETKKLDFEGYRPEEMPKLENAVVISDGCFAAMCVTNDSDAARTVIGRY